MTSVIETYDEVVHAGVVEERLGVAIGMLGEERAEERGWLESARHRVAAARVGHGDLLERVLELPELRSLRGDKTRELQNAAVDAVDGLLAAITAHNARSPLIDAIFRNLKPIAMRRAKNDDFEQFLRELEKRLVGSYVGRMLADETYAPIAAPIEKMRAAFTAWREALHPPPRSSADDDALRHELTTASERVALPIKQALLLAEAALQIEPAIRESSCIFERPRKRSARERAA